MTEKLERCDQRRPADRPARWRSRSDAELDHGDPHYRALPRQRARAARSARLEGARPAPARRRHVRRRRQELHGHAGQRQAIGQGRAAPSLAVRRDPDRAVRAHVQGAANRRAARAIGHADSPADSGARPATPGRPGRRAAGRPGSCRIGRARGGDLVLDSRYVSREQLRADWDGRSVFRSPTLGSSNGTWLEGSQLPKGQPIPWEWGRDPTRRAVLPQAGSSQAHRPDRRQPGQDLDHALKPTQPDVLKVTLTNLGDTVDHLTVLVDGTGVRGDWWVGPEQEVQLNPRVRTTVPVTVNVPNRPDSRAGEYEVQVAGALPREPGRVRLRRRQLDRPAVHRGRARAIAGSGRREAEGHVRRRPAQRREHARSSTTLGRPTTRRC